MSARIEFLGVPGAGKSSLTPVAIDELRRSGADAGSLDDAVYAALRAGMQDRLMGPAIRYLPDRVGRSVYKHLTARSQDRVLALRRFLLEHPDTFIAILSALRDRRGIDLRQDLALGWMIELLWRYQFVTDQSEQPAYLVLDEGFCNRAVSLFGYRFSADDEPRLRRYVDAIPRPDLVIVVSGDPEAVAARVATRQRFGGLTNDEAIEYTRDAAACVEATVQLLAEREVEVRTVRNDSSLGAAAHAVRQTIRALLEGR